MKKVLFATTALVASAGIASAQGVELSGSAEMGIIGGDMVGNDVEFHTDIDVTFTMSGETDNGLTFGASIDLDEADDSAAGGSLAFGNRTQGGETIFISGSFGTLTMGDTDGALDWAMTEVAIGGAIADDHTTHFGYNGNSVMDGFTSNGNARDGQIARYDYSFGDFAFAVSAELEDTPVAGEGATLGVGATYSGDLGGVTLGVGLGYQQADNGANTSSAVGMSLSAAMDNGFQAIVNYTSFSNVAVGRAGGIAVDNHMAIGIGYSMDALTFGLNYGVYAASTAGEADASGFGLTANYDLGGGASVQFGYGSGSRANTATAALGDTVSQETWSLGVAMSF